MKLLLIAALVALSATAATAQIRREAPESREQKAFMRACGGDMNTICNPRGDPSGVMACLRANTDKITDRCKVAVSPKPEGGGGMSQGEQTFVSACGADMDKQCSGENGPGMMVCLRAHVDTLSRACRSVLPKG